MSEQIARTEKQLGAILRRARKQAGLTQGSLGTRIHLRQGTISRLEAGEPAVQRHTLMEAVSALELELVVRPRSQGSPADIEDLFSWRGAGPIAH
ncbi:helix-turn-helix domain-containing protein [Methylobacterium sp. J-030]|uniref:helix-turn-helix domain-containing protein n=1 Tax=Methylobacterium sp. J-030 TaxID=2836627 RepID=UPI001FBB5C13|nr:helix-turn-helix domain-containing protein [Methylobacterium sp. J-030]MCJ2072095.1 helix-turn-helix domain-containing protein [Methylobacterium sp. J-030]